MRRLITTGLGGLVWLWVVYTVYAVGRFGGAVVIDSETTSRIMAVRNNGEVSSAVGLTYHGLGGATLVVVELLLIIGALLLSLNSRRWARLLSSTILCLWTGLWFGNAVWLQSVGWDRQVEMYGMGTAMLITLAWIAVRRLPQLTVS